MPTRRVPKGSNRAPGHSPPISPSVRTGEAPIYRALAAAAKAAGYAVSAAQVHEWVKAGLVPPTGAQVSVGRHGFATVPAPGVEGQLLALCRLRGRTKSWRALTVLLWAEGWPIEPERVRAAVLAWFPGTRLPARPSERQFDDWDALARRLAPKLAARLGLGRIGPAAEDGLYAGLLVSAGLGRTSLDEEGAAAIERLAGMAPHARNDQLDGTGPWLSGSALTGLEGLRRSFSVERLRSLVETASEADLELARARVRFFVIELPEFVRVIELFGGRHFLGLGALPRLLGRAPEVGVPFALFFAAEGYAEPMDTIAEAWRSQAGPMQAALAKAEDYLAQHPDLREAVRRHGLRALVPPGMPAP